MENPDFNYEIYWSRIFLKFVGIWKESEEKTNLLLKFKYYGITLLILYFIIIPQTVYIFVNYKDTELVMNALTIGDLSVAVGLLKYITFWFKRKELQPLLMYMKKDWKNSKKKRHLKKMRQISKKVQKSILGITILTEFAVSSYLMVYIYMLSNDYFETDRLLLLSYFPYDTYVTPTFEFMIFFQYISASILALIYTNIDGFIAILLLHICGQLNILQYELQHLTDPAVNGNKNAIDIIRRNLSFITQRHEHLIRRARRVEHCFNLIFLMQLILLSFQFCCQGYIFYSDITNDKGVPIYLAIYLLFYTISIVSLFFLYCYMGDQLATESFEIGNAAYKCDWTYLPPSEIKSLIFIILQTKSPVCITAGKFCSLTMVTFSETIKRSFGYFSVLLTMNAKL